MFDDFTIDADAARSAELLEQGWAFGPGWPADKLELDWKPAIEAMVVVKRRPGFDADCICALTTLVGRIAAGELPTLKYLVLDFAHGAGRAETAPPDGFEELVSACAELVLDAPVITVAFARAFMMGSDLDFALHCPVVAATPDAQFSFEGDPMALIGLYATLAPKIGYVKAERLLESGGTLSAKEMRDLMILKDVVPGGERPPIETFLRSVSRRFNASQAIFRAQRMAVSPMERALASRGRR